MKMTLKRFDSVIVSGGGVGTSNQDIKTAKADCTKTKTGVEAG